MTTRKIWCDVIFRTLHGYETVKQRDKPLKTKKTKGSSTWFQTISLFPRFMTLLIDSIIFWSTRVWFHCQKKNTNHRSNIVKNRWDNNTEDSRFGRRYESGDYESELGESLCQFIVSLFDPPGGVVFLLSIIIKSTTHTSRDRIQTRQNSVRQ